MDCNLKKFVCIFEKWLKTDSSLYLLGEVPSCFPPGALRALRAEFFGREKVPCKIFERVLATHRDLRGSMKCCSRQLQCAV